ncbi:hypothetical protein N8667_06860, partial [Verrucomicrobia bacterium]|nr:hypothetical protein [Verrucomicrobiota bacterium]
DVTQEHANKKQSELFKQTLDRTFDAILMYEPENFRFIYANKSALKKNRSYDGRAQDDEALGN